MTTKKSKNFGNQRKHFQKYVSKNLHRSHLQPCIINRQVFFIHFLAKKFHGLSLDAYANV